MNYMDVANGRILLLAVSVLLLTVLAQTCIMIKKGWKEALRLGVSHKTLRLAVKNSISITAIPAVPIVITLFLLVPLLGRYIPWLRLSVIGSGMFEMMAAEIGAQAAGASGLVAQGFTKEAFVSAVWCMSIGGSCSLFFSLIALKPVCRMYDRLKNKDSKLIQITGGVAMMSLFVSFAVDKASKNLTTAIIIAVTIIFTAMCLMIAKKYKVKWILDFILPISIIFGLVFSYIIGNYFI